MIRKYEIVILALIFLLGMACGGWLTYMVINRNENKSYIPIPKHDDETYIPTDNDSLLNARIKGAVE